MKVDEMVGEKAAKMEVLTVELKVKLKVDWKVL